MISSLPATGQMPPPQRSLTETQNTQLTDLLSGYDPDALSDDDAKALVESIKELGIAPGKGLATALDEAGFDARGLAEQAGLGRPGGPGGAGGPPGGRGGPGGPGGQGGPGGAGGQGGPGGVSDVDQAIIDMVKQAAETAESSDTEASFADTLKTLMEQNGYEDGTPIVDFYA